MTRPGTHWSDAKDSALFQVELFLLLSMVMIVSAESSRAFDSRVGSGDVTSRLISLCHLEQMSGDKGSFMGASRDTSRPGGVSGSRSSEEMIHNGMLSRVAGAGMLTDAILPGVTRRE